MGAWAQSDGKPAAAAFEVASIKPSAPLDVAKLAADARAGQMPKLGAHINQGRAEYIYMTIRDLIVQAYRVRPNQVTGPDWITMQRYDIEATFPDGASKDAAPQMLQTLLEDRFKLALHRDSPERPVLALVVGKGGPKLKPSAAAPPPIDESAPLHPGEMSIDSPQGPVRVSAGQGGVATMNMGSRGMVTYSAVPGAGTMHVEARGITAQGLTDLLTQFFQTQGGASGPPIVNMTNLEGNYDLTFDFSLADLLNMARAAGVMLPPGAAAPPTAADSGGGTSLAEAVQGMGLALEQKKQPVEQLVIDHVEMPSPN